MLIIFYCKALRDYCNRRYIRLYIIIVIIYIYKFLVVCYYISISNLFLKYIQGRQGRMFHYRNSPKVGRVGCLYLNIVTYFQWRPKVGKVRCFIYINYISSYIASEHLLRQVGQDVPFIYTLTYHILLLETSSGRQGRMFVFK